MGNTDTSTDRQSKAGSDVTRKWKMRLVTWVHTHVTCPDSHTPPRTYVKQVGSDVIRKSKIHLVDLAGSERVYKTGNSGV